FVIGAALSVLLVCASLAQFGGLGGKIKEKLQKATETFTPWTPEEEQAIGDAAAAKMAAMFGFVDNEAANRYVNLVGAAVAQYASRQLPYRFAVLNTDIVGAWAIPGGFIFISRGALASMTNEAELAGALGHELVHCSERHLEKEIRSKKTSAWAVEELHATGKGQVVTTLKIDALVKDLFTTRLSRDKEDQADEQGTVLAAQAGYSANGLMEFLGTLQGLAHDPANNRMFGQLLSTHPPFDARIAHLGPVVQRLGMGGQTLEERYRKTLVQEE
ncbi:MAG TPA: M48 family metalloprotease, partial [Bryobacteraceae bacterium]|nr:M48 family metalloprotease [Bryobacteraceae bacterium]